MVALFMLIIGMISIVLGLGLGLFGILLLPVLVGFCYLLVDSILVELLWWLRERNQ
jgi:hypothetical protein